MITSEQQHLLAADAVTEVPEEEAADRTREEPDGERAEGRELRRRAGRPLKKSFSNTRPAAVP